MSKPLLQKLENALNSGELFEWADICISNTEILAKLGYSGKGQYCGIVRDFLQSKDIDCSHFIVGGKVRQTPTHAICAVCGNSFIHPPTTKTQITCGYSCSNTYFRSGENNPNWKNGRNYREKAFNSYEHKCNRCDYDNVLALEVHHKDKNRSNNDISNLEILCANCHSIEHKNSGL